jgi:TRAP-type uncharacterized transport system fused permease subunit
MFPSLLFIQFSLPDFIEGFMTTFLGIYAFGSCAIGFLRRSCVWWERVLLLLAGLALVSPWLEWELAGAAILAVMFFRQRLVAGHKNAGAQV